MRTPRSTDKPCSLIEIVDISKKKVNSFLAVFTSITYFYGFSKYGVYQHNMNTDEKQEMIIMSRYALLICRSQTEAQSMRRQLSQIGVPGEVTQPPRQDRTESCGWAVRVLASQADEAVHRLRTQGISPCRVLRDSL